MHLPTEPELKALQNVFYTNNLTTKQEFQVLNCDVN